ncbi:MAG: hypothetical protein ABNH27_12335 [Alcanivorax sp.]|jgi:hypothetical protein|uniref:hypothetical protein n=1 Tax=Alcanivorax sp. TaxID=1872427 RepID=UPI0032D934C7|tara:strand:+ start:382 stop:579 length:198 start_codon:yes stop_codon:yes gene_type:complete
MTIDHMLERLVAREVAKLDQGEREKLIEQVELFEDLVKKGIMEPDGYGAAPISTMPIGTYALKVK